MSALLAGSRLHCREACDSRPVLERSAEEHFPHDTSVENVKKKSDCDVYWPHEVPSSALGEYQDASTGTLLLLSKNSLGASIRATASAG